MAAIIATAMARVAYLLSPKANFNADEAITGIMVRNILHGQNYAFYAGQRYGGTAEQYLQALMYLVLRLPQNPFTLRLVQVALSCATCALVYMCGRIILRDDRRAALACVLFAIFPWFNVIGTATSQGFYVAAQLCEMLALYIALRMDRRTPSARSVAVFGLLCGLSVWTSVTTVYVVLVAALWAAPYLLSSARRVAAFLCGVAVGAAPLLHFVLTTGQLPLPDDSSPAISIARRLGNLLGPVLREFVGLTYAHGKGELPAVVQTVVVWIISAGFMLLLIRRRRGITALLKADTAHRDPVDLLLLVPLVVIPLYISSSQTWYTGTPRYLLTLFPILALAMGYLPIGLPAWTSSKARRLFTAFSLILVCCCALSTWGFFDGQTVTPTIRERDRTLSTVVRTLVNSGETNVYAGYWTAMPLQYVARDALRVAVCSGTPRFPESQAEVASHPDPVYVTSSLDGTTALITTRLTERKLTFRETQIGFVTIIDELGPQASPTQLGF